MYQITMSFKSGKEYSFSCESYTIDRFVYNGGLANFSYKGGVGMCPIFYRADDIESIAVLKEEEKSE